MPVLFTSNLLGVNTDAYEQLPLVAKEYVKNILHNKCANENNWVWDEIKWEFNFLPDFHYIKLCFTGSPSRDIGIIWGYNTSSQQYEEYLTQYYSPISPLRLRNKTNSFDELLQHLHLLRYEDMH